MIADEEIRMKKEAIKEVERRKFLTKKATSASSNDLGNVESIVSSMENQSQKCQMYVPVQLMDDPFCSNEWCVISHLLALGLLSCMWRIIGASTALGRMHSLQEVHRTAFHLTIVSISLL
jgi:hypothetical protein